ncbi:MAG TPA: hypothetical protein VGI92_01660, partial [Gemmatimonadales bacterium]
LVPDGGITLFSHRSARGDTRGSLVGPRADDLALAVMPGDRIWAIRFWPDSGGLVLGEDPERLAGHFVQPLTHPQWAVLLLRALADCRDAASAAEVADRLLGDVIASASAPDAVARQAVQALIATHGEIGIAEIAEGMGISLRQLERRFSAAVGLDPIQFGRIRKMKGNLGPLLGNTPRTWNEVLPILLEARP